MCMCVYVCVCVSIHMYSHICVCVSMSTCEYACVHASTHIRTSSREDEGQRTALRSWFFPATLWALSSNSSPQTCSQVLPSPCQASSVAQTVGSRFFSLLVSGVICLHAVVLAFLPRSFALLFPFSIYLMFYPCDTLSSHFVFTSLAA